MMHHSHSWVWVDFTGEPAALEQLQAELLDTGCIGGEERAIEGETVLRLYWEPSQDPDSVMASAEKACARSGAMRLRIGAQEQEDWLALWKAHYGPIRVSDRVWIIPDWLEAPPGQQAADAVVVKIHPAMAFGTGDHPTTRLCLQLLTEHVQPGDTVLDLGCGSGILAIAAAKLGAGSVLAVDADPEAVANAEENVRINHVEDRVTTRVTQGGQPEPCRTTHVICNIITAHLVPLVPYIATTVDGGVAMLSGVDQEHRAEVRDALKDAALDIRDERRLEQWCAFVCTPRAS